MRASLQALTDELRRLKASGVSTVSVPAESIERLRNAIATLRPPEAVKPPKPIEESTHQSLRRAPESSSSPAPKEKAAEPALPPPPVITLPVEGDKQAQHDWLTDYVRSHAVVTANLRPGTKAVLGMGNLDANIMFVSEAPGAEEEIQGEPLIGPAGQLLTKMIQAMELSREEVYVGSIMSWCPRIPDTPLHENQTGNRSPTPEELAFCLSFLRAQIEIVKPKVLVALGSTTAQGLLAPHAFKALHEVRGKWHDFDGTPVMVTYHPSYILRNNSNRSKRVIWEDLLKVMQRVELPISERQQGYFSNK